MSAPFCTCLLVSDFNVKTLGSYLENAEEPPPFEVVHGPYGQVAPALLDGTLECWQRPVECLVAWTQPESVVPAFRDLLEFRGAAPELLDAEVDAYAELLLRAAGRARLVLAPSWELPAQNRGWGLLDGKPGLGLRAALWRMNLRLAEKLQAAPNAFVLDADRWMRLAGKNAASAKLWFLGKVPFANEVFAEAARDVRAAVAAQRGQARKLVVVDLDDTLWGGIVGDVGWEALRLGGHDHVGEAHVDFQRSLRALKNRGIILGIVSKNDEAVALDALARHPEMVLRQDDFAGWRINWSDKAQNLVELAAELRLGLQSVVFLDDNPVERARVRETLPEVLVPEWPADPMLYTGALTSLRCFDVPSATAEDAARASMYAVDKQRDQSLQKVGNLDEWLASLHMTVTIEPLGDSNLTRTTQLLNKTNQMNLATRRLTEPELKEWAALPGNRLWAFRVADRFGDSGLTGIVSVSARGSDGEIADYVLSCRVMGRRVEETLLGWAVARAREAGLRRLTATWLPTAKNRPTLEFLRRSGWRCLGPSAQRRAGCEDDVRFVWDLAAEYPIPSFIEIVTP